MWPHYRVTYENVFTALQIFPVILVRRLVQWIIDHVAMVCKRLPWYNLLSSWYTEREALFARLVFRELLRVVEGQVGRRRGRGVCDVCGS